MTLTKFLSKFAFCFFTVFAMLVISAFCGCRGEPASMGLDRGTTAAESATESRADTLVGRLLLPGKGGRRGVEIHVWVSSPDGEVRQLWVFPDADGRFTRVFEGAITHLIVNAGKEVHRIDGDDLPRVDDSGRVDLGVIDLQDALVPYRVRIGSSVGARSGFVRAALWIGPIHTGPRGELPSLGSMQFPTRPIDRVAEWLVPPDTDDVYFLVEYSDESGDDRGWRSDKQQVFGPYESQAFPIELLLD